MPRYFPVVSSTHRFGFMTCNAVIFGISHALAPVDKYTTRFTILDQYPMVREIWLYPLAYNLSSPASRR